MSQTIIFYRNCKIRYDKNFFVDNIGDYLNTLQKYEPETFQYIKDFNQLSVEVKIDIGQDTLISDEDNSYNYVEIIKSYDHPAIYKHYYYFVKNMEWRSSQTVKLYLEMDVVNTFRPGSDFNFSDKTKIIRQHKDRFDKAFFRNREQVTYKISVSTTIGTSQDLDGYYSAPWMTYTVGLNTSSIDSIAFDGTSGIFVEYSFNISLDKVDYRLRSATPGESVSGDVLITTNEDSYNNAWYRKIDLYSEGITPQLYKEEQGYIQDISHLSWFLIYKGDTSLDMFLVPEIPIKIKVTGDSTITGADLISGQYYYLMWGLFESSTEYVLTGSTSFDNINAERLFVIFRASGTDIKYRVVNYQDDGLYKFISDERTTSSVKFYGRSGSGYREYDWIRNEGSVTIKYMPTDTQDISVIKNGALFPLNLSNSIEDIIGVNQIDKSNTQIVKIIELPYCPSDINKYTNLGTDYFSVGNEWQYIDDNGANGLGRVLKYRAGSYKVAKNFRSNFSPLGHIFNPSSLSFTGKTLHSLKDIDYESKLYHSDYYQPEFVYDSFSFVFALEKVDVPKYADGISYYPYTSFLIDFKVTTTVNSKFMFTFPQYITKYGTENYDNVMIVSRNNEVSVYNSDYINYIRSGYNYDIKAKERNVLSNWLQIGNSFTGVDFSQPLRMTSSVVRSTIGAVTSQINAEQSMQAKLKSLSLQSVSVAGSDDVDLMGEYTGNRMKYVIYSVSPQVRKALWDVFFYTGYVANYLGVPTYNTREWFNFVSCEPIFEDVKNISQNLLEELDLKYQGGVTFLHKVGSEWDFEQQYENWETSLEVTD